MRRVRVLGRMKVVQENVRMQDEWQDNTPLETEKKAIMGREEGKGESAWVKKRNEAKMVM